MKVHVLVTRNRNWDTNCSVFATRPLLEAAVIQLAETECADPHEMETFDDALDYLTGSCSWDVTEHEEEVQSEPAKVPA